MPVLKIICCAIIFITRLRFPRGTSIATVSTLNLMDDINWETLPEGNVMG